MRLLLFLIPLLLAATSFGQEDLQELSSADLFQKFLDVEQQIKEQWGNDYEVFRKKQKDQQEKFNKVIQAVNEKFKEKSAELKDIFDKIRQAKEERDTEKAQQREEAFASMKQAFEAMKIARNETKEREKQQWTDLFNRLKEKWNEKMQEAAEEKKKEVEDFKQSLQNFKDKWEDWVAKVDQAKYEAWDKQKQKLEESKQDFENLKQAVKDELQRRHDAKLKRKEDRKAKLDEYREDIQAKKDELDGLEAEALEKIEAVSQKKQEIQDIIDKALGDQARAMLDEQTYSKIQENLDKAAAKELFKEMMTQNTGSWPSHSKKAPGMGKKETERPKEKVSEKPKETTTKTGQTAADQMNVAPAKAEAKATVLDEITGTSQWQTVTWILLGLSILLTIALIALIMYQIAQRKQYQQLDGYDDPERTPLTRHPEGLHYTDVGTSSASAPKGILAVPKSKAVVPVAEDPTAPSMEPVI